MFYVKKLHRNILLGPAFLGPHLKGIGRTFLSTTRESFSFACAYIEAVKRRIFNELEGTCLGKHGYVIFVLGKEVFIL